MIKEWVDEVHQGDAVDVLSQMPESSVHTCVTSPPYYGQRDYGEDEQIGLEDTLDEYIQNLVDVGNELQRVLRDDGTWWLNLGDKFAQSGRSNQDKSGTAPDGQGHSRGHDAGGFRNKQKMFVPHRVAIALQESGWLARNDNVWHKTNALPEPHTDRFATRFEFVFLLANSDDYYFDLDSIREPYAKSSIKDFERGYGWSDGKYVGDSSPHSEGGTNDPDRPRSESQHPAGKNPGDVWSMSTESFSGSHFAVFPPDLIEKPIKAGCPEQVCVECGTPHVRERVVESREIKGGVHTVPEDERGYSEIQGQSQNDRAGLTQPTSVSLGDWEKQCNCETDSTEPGIVIDPFMGTGTTAIVAERFRRRWVGIDLSAEYVDLAGERISTDRKEKGRPANLLDIGRLEDD